MEGLCQMGNLCYGPCITNTAWVCKVLASVHAGVLHTKQSSWRELKRLESFLIFKLLCPICSPATWWTAWCCWWTVTSAVPSIWWDHHTQLCLTYWNRKLPSHMQTMSNAALVDADVMDVDEICLQGNPEEHTILEFARLIKSLVGKASNRSRYLIVSRANSWLIIFSFSFWLFGLTLFHQVDLCFCVVVLAHKLISLFLSVGFNTFVVVPMDVYFLIWQYLSVITYSEYNYIVYR